MQGKQEILASIFMTKSNEENTDASKENSIVNLMALMRVLMAIPETFEDLTLS